MADTVSVAATLIGPVYFVEEMLGAVLFIA
jgi:hypothetical protein